MYQGWGHRTRSTTRTWPVKSSDVLRLSMPEVPSNTCTTAFSPSTSSTCESTASAIQIRNHAAPTGSRPTPRCPHRARVYGERRAWRLFHAQRPTSAPQPPIRSDVIQTVLKRAVTGWLRRWQWLPDQPGASLPQALKPTVWVLYMEVIMCPSVQALHTHMLPRKQPPKPPTRPEGHQICQAYTSEGSRSHNHTTLTNTRRVRLSRTTHT